MSSLIVEVCEILSVESHPQADRLEIAVIKGWRTVIGKGQFKAGDKVVYLPPDCIIPTIISDRWNVTKYLSSVKENGVVVGGRVKVARLRGEPSYGFVVVPEQDWTVGTDVAAHFGITKWEPSISSTDGDSEREHPAFHKYTDWENINNFPDLIQDEEIVEISEKLHGKNLRLGLIRIPDENGNFSFEFMAGSHDVRRKEFCILNKTKINSETGEKETYQVTKKSQFWEVYDKYPNLKDMLQYISQNQHDVVIFGEIFGSSVQDLTYNMKNGEWDFRLFDISVNGKYMDADQRIQNCQKFNIPTVPILYVGPFSRTKINEYVSGNTTLCDNQIREGVVVKLVKEECRVTPNKVFNRVGVKAINFDYQNRKNATEFH